MDMQADTIHKQFMMIAVALIATAVLLTDCVVPSDTPQTEFRFNHQGSIDTIAPFGSFPVSFSEPLNDSSGPELIFNPRFYSFVLTGSSTNDTFMVQLSEPLEGNTVYTIRLKNRIYSSGNSLFEPESDSLTVITRNLEQEPNNTIPLADTLRQMCFGSSAAVDDTDRYVITGRTGKVFLHSFGSQTRLSIDKVSFFNPLREFTSHDTLAIPDTTTFPLHVAVFPYLRSVGGYYELGWIAAGR